MRQDGVFVRRRGPNRKLMVEQGTILVAMYQGEPGVRVAEIASRFGVSRQTVYATLARQRGDAALGASRDRP